MADGVPRTSGYHDILRTYSYSGSSSSDEEGEDEESTDEPDDECESADEEPQYDGELHILHDCELRVESPPRPLVEPVLRPQSLLETFCYAWRFLMLRLPWNWMCRNNNYAV
jgi:hypothetical protein